jgi:hypothetical protein
MTDINVAAQDGYRIGILLSEIESGKSPDEAAETLYSKTAELKELNDYIEQCLLDAPLEKQAALFDHPGRTLAWGLDGATSSVKNLALLGGITGGGLLAAGLLPAVGGAYIGRGIGDAAGSLAAESSPVGLEDLSRIEEIDAYRQAADEVLRRIERVKSKQKRRQIPSARSMF